MTSYFYCFRCSNSGKIISKDKQKQHKKMHIIEDFIQKENIMIGTSSMLKLMYWEKYL